MRRRTYFFISFLVLGLLAPFCVLGDSNNITALVFTTNPQTVAGNTASQAITVQAENSAGTVEKVSETNDVTFTSTSATGQFLNSTGGAVSGTMSTNTSSRTFYYEDSTTGTYTITVTIKGRTSGKQFTASQSVTVGGTGNSSSSNTSSDQSSASSTSNTLSNNSDQDSSYSYTSQTYIYQGPDNETFNISIGRNRLVVVGEPVTFNPRPIPESVSFSGMNMHWAFGDGTEWTGSAASHTYEYPGDYVVVVDANRYGEEAVAEAKVKVVNADTSVSLASDGSVVIANNAGDEINVGGFSLVDDVGRFLLPQDTIVASHSSVTIPANVMKTRKFSGTVALYNPEQTKMSSTFADKDVVTDDVAISLPSEMSADELEQKLVAAMRSENGIGNTVAVEEPAPSESSGGRILKGQVASQADSSLQNMSATSSVAAVIYAIPKSKDGSIFSSIVSWFGGLFGKK